MNTSTWYNNPRDEQLQRANAQCTTYRLSSYRGMSAQRNGNLEFEILLPSSPTSRYFFLGVFKTEMRSSFFVGPTSTHYLPGAWFNKAKKDLQLPSRLPPLARDRVLHPKPSGDTILSELVGSFTPRPYPERIPHLLNYL